MPVLHVHNPLLQDDVLVAELLLHAGVVHVLGDLQVPLQFLNQPGQLVILQGQVLQVGLELGIGVLVGVLLLPQLLLFSAEL